MEQEFDKILEEYEKGNMNLITLRAKLLHLFSVSKRHLVENILDDVKQSHPEYAIEKIENYLDDGC